MNKRFYLALISLLLFQQGLYAEEVVRINMTSDSVDYDVDVTLFEELTPATTANFLTYVDDTDYVNSFFHRLEPGFVLQGGGFTYNSAMGPFIYGSGLLDVPTDPPVANKYKLSNVRGTLAMARLPDDPDSATSQWFINLGYNSLTLDLQNGGFTVFGRVLGAGMDTVDILAATPVTPVDAHPEFTSLPLNDLDNIEFSTDITETNLLMVNSMTRLFNIDTRVDFGAPAMGVPVNRNIVITNYDQIDLVLPASIDTSALAPELSVNTSDCENKTLTASQSCTMVATLTPGAAPTYAGTFDVDLIDPDYSFEVTLTTPAPDIAVSLEHISFGEQQLYIPETSFRTEQVVLFIGNIGDQDLNINTVSVAGTNDLDILIVDNCTGLSPLAPGDSCLIPTNFAPKDLGDRTAQITIETNDPDEPVTIVTIDGTSKKDLDTIADTIEDAAPNTGDANNDGLIDSYQNHVASFITSGNNYITVATDNFNTLGDITLVDPATLPPLPGDIVTDNGVFTVTLPLVSADITGLIGFIMPEGVLPTNVYFYGPTSDNTVPHWYTVEDRTNIIAGAIMAPTIEQATLSGTIVRREPETILRNLVSLNINDGQEGDSDGLVNGELVLTIAINSINQSNSDDGGWISALMLVIIIVIITLLRNITLPVTTIKR